MVVNSYRESFFPARSIKEHGVSLSSVRAGNVLGGGDWGNNRIVPDCIRALSKGETVLVRNPGATRPWQYVWDALSGYLCLAEAQGTGDPAFSQGWNFGPLNGLEWSVEKLVTHVVRLWGSGDWRSVENGDQRGEAHLLSLDSGKARERLGWQPVYSLEEALENTVVWYRKAQELAGDKLLSFTIEQLRDYFHAARDRKSPWALGKEALSK